MNRSVLVLPLVIVLVLLGGRRSGSSGEPAGRLLVPFEARFDLGDPFAGGDGVDGVDYSREFDFGEAAGDAEFDDDLDLDLEFEYEDSDGDDLPEDWALEAEEPDDDGFLWEDDAADDVVPSPSLSPELTVPAAGLEELGRIPGEFERQDALLLGAGELVWAAPDILTGIVSAVARRIRVVALYDTEQTRTDVVELLRQNDLSAESIAFLAVPHDTMWVRDYGPLGRVRDDGTVSFLDTLYSEAGRFSDDDTPARLSISLGVLHADVPLRLDGGNLITNGRGLCLTTTIVLEENGMEDAAVIDILDEYLGCEQALVLEPIQGEDTGHVDMFAVFTSPDTVVVGRYDEEDDEENCALLDRNAERLAEVRTPNGPLRVVRLPMPSAEDGIWRTYTNVVFANGCLLVPTYTDDNPAEEIEAFATYRSLLPAWDIRGVDASIIVGSGGALHCVTRNVFSLGRRKSELSMLRADASPRVASDPRSSLGFDGSGRNLAPWSARR